MNICKTTVKASTRPVSGRLYRVVNIDKDRIYIYCEAHKLFVNMETGSFAHYEESRDSLVDVTDQYCLQKV